MFWHYLLCALCAFGGYFYGCFGIMIPMICVNFAFPATKKLLRAGYAKYSIYAVNRKYRSTVILWACINAAIAAVAIFFVPVSYSASFAAGIVAVIITSFKRTFATPDNIKEYLACALPHLKVETEDDLFEVAGFLLH